MKRGLFFVFSVLAGIQLQAQRSYAPRSVLATGNWYKIAVAAPGIYRIDLPFLASMGLNTAGINSNSLRLFGNGGAMLPEANAPARPDDLQELAIEVVDGGDGVLNGSDYLLFYANGPDEWLKDSVNQSFIHKKNLYSGESYYFLTIGGTGKRIAAEVNPASANQLVTSYNERWFYEADLINLLSSGKEWLGEEFSANPGQQLARSFSVTLRHLLPGPVRLSASLVGRSGGSGSSFSVAVNGGVVAQANLPPVTGNPLDAFATNSAVNIIYNGTQDGQQINVAYTPGSANAQGWLNWLRLNARCQLNFSGYNQLRFRDWASVGAGNVADFQIQTAPPGLQVWEVTEPANIRKQTGSFSGNTFRFNRDASRLREYIAFDGNALLTPIFKETVPNQNLHESSPADFIIIHHPTLTGEANRLATEHRQRDGMRVLLVTPQQVYNEFSSGSTDPAALRDFVKMYYDKYNSNPSTTLKYLLLFGDASFDYRNRINPNTNLVPAWENAESLNPLQSYVSDDFYGFLDDAEDANSLSPALLDVGIGRIPARDAAEAKQYVDKVIAYRQPESFGPWRNQLSLVADDEDGNLHLNDAEILTNTLNSVAPVFTKEKTYFDAFRQESGSGGSRYPQVNEAINNQVFNGTLVWNYSGHGGSRRLADEAVLDADMVNQFKNEKRLPLFITATCDFAPYDNPLQFSIGENLLLRPASGAIALMTTTRVVFAFANRVMNNNYLQFAFQRNAAGRYPTLGDATRLAKNYTYTTSADITNNRKFTLLGDPALTLAFPFYNIRTRSINNRPFTATADTIKATGFYTIEGEVLDENNNPLPAFNGTVYPVVFDRNQQGLTLANDPGSVPTSFETNGNILFRGKATVTNGRFSFSFIAPRDMQYATGNGRFVYYADNAVIDGNGASLVVAGGNANNSFNDTEGPRISAWLNDKKFVTGGLTNTSPILLVSLQDSSGINTSGAGVGHEITAVIDDDTRNTLVLNNFYEAGLNSFRQGDIRVPLPALAPGPHQVRIKAWDVLNNPAETVLDFIVGGDEQLQLAHVLNYPNPFTTNTRFWFEHNRPGENLRVTVTVLTVTGKRVITIENTINTPGNRSCETTWDGKDAFGDRVARGVYIYQLSVQTPDGQKVLKTEKLVIL
jgi:hypothetical protein